MNAYVAQRRGRYDAGFNGALGAVTGRRERPGPGGILCTYEPLDHAVAHDRARTYG